MSIQGSITYNGSFSSSLTVIKVQIYENTQFLYHEPQFNEDYNQNGSNPDQSNSEVFNATNLELHVGDGIVYQPDAPSDLKVISQAPGVPLGKTKSYAYDPQNGAEAVIYMIENGIDGRKSVITQTQAPYFGTDTIRNLLGPPRNGFMLPA